MTQLTGKIRSVLYEIFIVVFISFNYSENHTDYLFNILSKKYLENMSKVVLDIQLFIDYINFII